MAEPAIRFPGALKKSPNLPAFVEKHLGYHLKGVGDDYVIAADDPQLLSGPRPALSIHEPLPLSGKNRHKLSGMLMRYIPGQMNPYFEDKAQRIEWNFYESSELTRAYQLQTDISVAPVSDVRRILRDRVLSFMIDEVGAVSVCPITVDSNLQQAHLSLAKFGLLSDKHDSPLVEELVFKRKVYKAVMPRALDLFSYVVCLTRLMPCALILPVERSDCAWHFVPSRALFFEDVRCTSLFELFSSPVNPLSKKSSLITLLEMASL